MALFGALLVLNMALASFIILAQPDGGAFAEGGKLIVEVVDGETDVSVPVWLDDDVNVTCTTPCTLDLDHASGSVTLGLESNVTRTFYVPRQTTQAWTHEVGESPSTAPLVPAKVDAAVPMVLVGAGVVSLYAAVRLWRVREWRLPLIGALAVGLSGVLVFNVVAIAAGAFALWAVLSEKDRLAGTVAWPTLEERFPDEEE